MKNLSAKYNEKVKLSTEEWKKLENNFYNNHFVPKIL